MKGAKEGESIVLDDMRMDKRLGSPISRGVYLSDSI